MGHPVVRNLSVEILAGNDWPHWPGASSFRGSWQVGSAYSAARSSRIGGYGTQPTSCQAIFMDDNFQAKVVCEQAGECSALPQQRASACQGQPLLVALELSAFALQTLAAAHQGQGIAAMDNPDHGVGGVQVNETMGGSVHRVPSVS